ncbi:MAG TPA: RNA polymerase sigma factor [Actinomycetota bacterium]|jgi:RNA polymerase sigma-70 factor (ECF subfamily)
MGLGESFASVIGAARLGAEWALSRLYADLQPHVLGYLRSRAPNEAEDLASETWIDVARGLARFQGGEPEFRRFVFAIARRRLIDHGRLASTRRTSAVPAADLEHRGATGDAEAEAMSRLSAEEAAASIAALLPADQADVILLRVLGGFTASEVAEIIGKSPGNVRVLQHRALAALARSFADARVTDPRREAM